jgi:four helix bundle protein
MGDFKQLKVWEKAQLLVDLVYEITGHFPASEKFGLISQMRRAASSVASNISEGAGRKGDKEFVRFLRIAVSSANELEGQLLTARRTRYLNETQWLEVGGATQEVRRMLHGLINFLSRSYSP